MQVKGNTLIIEKTIKPSSNKEILTTLNKILNDYNLAIVKILSISITSDLASELLKQNVIVHAKDKKLKQLLQELGVRVSNFI